MSYAGLPAAFINAFKKLYSKNNHYLKMLGRVFFAYVNESGVKTGGPASGSLFVLCIDPFLCMLRNRAHPRDIGRAFADDIGYVIYNLSYTLPRFVKCFALIAEVSNIHMKMKKTVVVSLWKCNVEDAKILLLNVAPEWSEVAVASSAKYLGIYLGMVTASLLFKDASNKFFQRVGCARSSGLGLLAAVAEYNTMCVPVFSYVSQFHVVPSNVLQLEGRMLQRMVKSPRFTFTRELLFSLKCVGLPMEFRSLRLSNIAAILRTALVTSTVFHTLLPIWDAAFNGDEISLLELQSGDCNRFDTPAMILTMRKAIDHAFLPDCGHRQWQSLMKTTFAHADNLTQKRIAEELKRLGGLFNAEDFFTKRMQRWYTLLSSAGQT